MTFAPSGSVVSAVVDKPPFAGTSTGNCVARRYLGLHITPFCGGNIKVGKAFAL